MSTWAYLLDDDTTGTVEADDLNAASSAVAEIADGRVALRVELVASPAPTVIRAASGASVVLDVGEGGTVVATPAAP